MRKQKGESTEDFIKRRTDKLYKVKGKNYQSKNPKKNPSINAAHFPDDPKESVYIQRNWGKFATRKWGKKNNVNQYIYTAKKQYKAIWENRNR